MNVKTIEANFTEMMALIDANKNAFLNESLSEQTVHVLLEKFLTVLVNNNYIIKFVVSESIKQEYNLASELIQIKKGNNGGYWCEIDQNGDVVLKARLRINDAKTLFQVKINEVQAILIFKEKEPVAEMVTLFRYIGELLFYKLFSKVDTPTVPVTDENVIQVNFGKK